ncbi:23S rRNA (pseudouridine(1915)-N(3))-methyltransferase RlmH [bacterium]|nr:23S rRNA (pseudouridine(1915)-N(3))-methyltransferase RlmH [bacterium]
MSKIVLLTVGKVQNPNASRMIGEYLKRLSRFVTLEHIPVKGEKLGSVEDQVILHREGERIRGELKEGDYLIALTDNGKALSTVDFKDFLNRTMIDQKRLVFIIGGPLGLEHKLINQSHFKLSLSRLTFPHELALVMLSEQIYRAFTIMSGHQYHK